jgi:hypothetical protein
MPDKFKSLSDVISKDAAFSKFRHSVKENNVVVEFENIFPKLSKTVTASNVNKGILYLIVDNSVLKNEIYINKNLMIEKINNHFSQQLIVDVKFTNFRNINRKTK